MNKFKKLMLATTTFFAFGVIANAADTWSFTKQAIGGDKLKGQYKKLTSDDSLYETWNNKYNSTYGFIVSGPSFACGTETLPTHTYYGIKTDGTVTKICDITKLGTVTEEEQTTTYLTTSEKNDGVKKCVSKGTEYKSCEFVSELKKDDKYNYSASKVELDSLYNGKEKTLYVISKIENETTIEKAIYNENGEKIIDWSTPSNIISGKDYIGTTVEKANSKTTYTFVTGNGKATAITKAEIISATGLTSTDIPQIDIDESKAYAYSADKNYYLINVSSVEGTHIYIIDSSTKKLVSDDLFGTTAELVKKDGSIYISEGTTLYDFNKKKVAEYASWTTDNSNLSIIDNEKTITVKYNSNEVIKSFARSTLLGDVFVANYLGSKDNVYYFISQFTNASEELLPSDYDKNSNLLVLKGNFDVEDSKETTITLDASEKTITVSGTTKLTATTANTKNTVTWTSSNDKIATVDKDGNVTGVAVGTATITATVDGKSVTAKITVNAKTTEEQSGNNGSGSGSNENIENPHTGAAISIVGLVGLAGAGVVINKKKGKKLFHKI